MTEPSNIVYAIVVVIVICILVMLVSNQRPLFDTEEETSSVYANRLDCPDGYWNKNNKCVKIPKGAVASSGSVWTGEKWTKSNLDGGGGISCPDGYWNKNNKCVEIPKGAVASSGSIWNGDKWVKKGNQPNPDRELDNGQAPPAKPDDDSEPTSPGVNQSNPVRKLEDNRIRGQGTPPAKPDNSEPISIPEHVDLGGSYATPPEGYTRGQWV